jgi:hypothetical protein
VQDERAVLYRGLAYRAGGFTYDNFTPRPGLDDRPEDWPIRGGLSLYTVAASAFGKTNRTAQEVDTMQLGADLATVQDPGDPEHILIKPRTYDELTDWSSARGSQSDAWQHPLTVQARRGRTRAIRRDV